MSEMPENWKDWEFVKTAPEKIWLNVSDDDFTWVADQPGSATVFGVPYIRADLVAAKDARIEFLEKALGQGACIVTSWEEDGKTIWLKDDGRITEADQPELAAWLREQDTTEKPPR